MLRQLKRNAYVVPQQRAACVTACVRMVLASFGQRLTEEQVRHVLQQAHTGITLPKAQRQLVRQGTSAGLFKDWSLMDLRDCLRAGWYPIVGVERRLLGHADASHAIVPVDISSQLVEALDPLGTATPTVFTHRTLNWLGIVLVNRRWLSKRRFNVFSDQKER